MLNYRDKRELEDVLRVIRKKAGEEARSPTSRIWTFLNSAFGLWLMTTVVVGSGVKFFTDHQECRKTAESSFRTYSKLNSELLHRAARVAEALFNSVTIGQANMVLTGKGDAHLALYSEYKSWTLDDVLFAWRLEGTRIGRNNHKLFSFLKNQHDLQSSTRFEDLFVEGGVFHSDDDLDIVRSSLEKIFDREKPRFRDEDKSFDMSEDDVVGSQCGLSQVIQW